MKKEIVKYLIFWFVYFLFLTIVNRLYSFLYWPLYVGGVVGLFIMPNLDHLLHIFVFKPQELTSVRVKTLISYKQYKDVITLLYDTRDERKDLIFHTILFQFIFTILTFWVVSSSGNLFARGLVLSYFLSLVLFNLNKFITEPKKTPGVSPWDELDSDMSSSLTGNPARKSGEDVINKEIILEDIDKTRIYFAIQVLALFIFGLLL